MHVYFEENYWGCQRENEEKEPGREIRLETGFTWKGRCWQIPAVYVCEKGLVADFCGRVERDEIRIFYEKWGARDEEGLSEKEREELSRENPFDLDFRVEAKVNEEKTQVQTGCGTSWCPPDLRPGDEAVSAGRGQVEEMLLEAYGLDLRAGWIFWRNSFAWPENRPGAISSLVFTMAEAPYSVPGPHFWTEEGGTGKTVELIHPKTGRTHLLTVLGQEAGILPEREFSPEMEIRSWPGHFQILHYQVEPELSDKEVLTLFDCARSDVPIYREQPAASSVAVIGGADGPTSVFLVGKQTDPEGRPKRRTAYSALHYTPEKTVEWKAVFRIDDEETKEVRVEL